MSNTLILSLELLIFGVGSLQAQGCDIMYLMEPLSSVPCNPYDGDDGTFELQCQVQAPATVASRLDLLWFFTNTSGDTVQISSETFSSLDAIRVTQNETSGDSLLLTSEISFRRFVSPTHAGSYFCRVSVNGAATSFSQSDSQTYDMETSAVINFSSTCDTYFDSFTQSVMRCAGNVTSTGFPSDPSTNIDPSATSTAMSPTPVSDTGVFMSMTTINPSQSDRSLLNLWVYILVGVAAVFGFIIVLLVALCIGLCLKKNKTTDSFKHKTPELRQFTTTSMVTNGLYQQKEDSQVTSGTHQSSHSQIADYNTLGERDYEIVEVNECKKDYNHLQRPSPPNLPGGRNGTFVFTPPKEFHSMSTLTSQQGVRVSGGLRAAKQQQQQPSQQAVMQHGLMSPAAGVGMFPQKSASEGPDDFHQYGELDHKIKTQVTQASRLPSMAPPSSTVATLPSIYRSPTDSVPPDSARSLQRRFMREGIDENDANLPGIQPAGLLNKPETGHIFQDPANPTSFPVHNYEKVSGEAEYETPIVTRKAKMAAAAPPPPAGRSSQSSMRGRSDSAGIRYETEHAQSFSESGNNGHYHRLVRHSGDHSSTSRETSRQDFDDVLTDVTSVAIDDGLSTIDSTMTMNNTLGGREQSMSAFTNPTSDSARASFQDDKSRFFGSSIYDPPSSASLSPYIDHMQAEDDDDEPMSDAMFEEIAASLGAITDGTALPYNPGNAKAMEMQNGIWNGHHAPVSAPDESPYSRLSTQGNAFHGDQASHRAAYPPQACRDVQNSNVDYGLSELSRLKKTTV